MNISWICKTFDELTPHELYAALRLRSEVFVVEQSCVFLDMDDKDQQSWHLLGMQQDDLAAYTRLVPPGVIYSEASIGRVVTAPFARRTGIGRELMQQSIKKVHELFGAGDIRIGAQYYLKQFYQSLGFIQTSEIYLEDGIEHIYMVLPQRGA